MGLQKGTVTSTADATRFSISRSMDRLYLDLTYSGLAAYKHATRPPSGVMPTRSPMPRTAAAKTSNGSRRTMIEPHTSINVGGPGFQSSICVCDS